MTKKGEPMTKCPKKLRRWVWLLALPLLQLGAGVAFAQQEPAAAVATSVSGQAAAQADTSTLTGTQACLHCHKESSEHVMKTVHSGTYDEVPQGVPKTSASTGCDGCHGSGKAHADAELEAERTDTKNPEAKKLIFDFESKNTTPEMVNERCLTCHASSPSHLNSPNSFHRQNDVSCINCHSPHHAATKEKLLIKAQPELCYGCHLQQKSQFNMPFHHRVNEGLIQCTDCHQQHGTAGVWESDHLVRQVGTSDNGDAVCFKCHKDKQGPFVFPHCSVKLEGCATCHIPHGGANTHMLKYSNVNLLCLQCHTAAHFGPFNTPAQEASNNGKPTGFAVMNGPVPNNAIYIQACTICHTAIHGSNFSDIYFR